MSGPHRCGRDGWPGIYRAGRSDPLRGWWVELCRCREANGELGRPIGRRCPQGARRGRRRRRRSLRSAVHEDQAPGVRLLGLVFMAWTREILLVPPIGWLRVMCHGLTSGSRKRGQFHRTHERAALCYRDRKQENCCRPLHRLKLASADVGGKDDGRGVPAVGGGASFAASSEDRRRHCKRLASMGITNGLFGTAPGRAS